MKKILAAVPGIVAGLVLLPVAPAEAAYSLQTICNAAASQTTYAPPHKIFVSNVNDIRVWHVVNAGSCVTVTYDGGARVNTNNGGSYRAGEYGQGYGACYSARISNPPNDWQKVTYKTYRLSGCRNSA